jgi:hypothetical protein
MMADDVEAALFLIVLFPPPSPGALRLTSRNRPGAWSATNRQKTLPVQWVDRDVIGGRK